jgi:glycosyltransferase involved in cell wall biosynthesis
MRILYFSRDYTPHDHRFLSALAKHPDVTREKAAGSNQVFYLRLENQGRPLEDRPLPPEIAQIAWAGGQSTATLRDGPRLLRDLKRVIRQVKPDLIQAGPLQRCAFLVVLAGFHPLVSMSWGYDLIHDANRSRSWRWATRYTLKHSDAMLGDCAAIRNLAIQHGMPGDRIVTFPWGIDLEHFSPLSSRQISPLYQQPGEKPQMQPFTLLSTRSWEPIYGVDIIAQAFAQAARQRPEMRLVMLGGGSQAQAIRRIFSQANIQQSSEADGAPLPQVIFPGQIKQAQLPDYYRRADLYIAATHSDGTSISLLEAMACGVPALVSDIFGNREWVTPERTGWLFPDGDPAALAQRIVQAFDQRADLAEMGRAARQVTEQRADWKRNFPRLFEAYQIALAKSASSPPSAHSV